MTGTLIGGRAGHVRSLLFRLCPKIRRAENLAWEDDMEFARRYGRVDTITTEKCRSGDDNRRSNGRTTTRRQVEQPGIMPTLYGRHLIGNTIFLSLKDVAADLPAYGEQPIPVRMSPGLEESYRKIEGELKEAVARLLRRGSHQLLSAMLHGLLAYPDHPYDWEPIGYVEKRTGSEGRFVTVTTPPNLDRDTLWPKERKLLEILTEEKAHGRQFWVFCVYTSTHPVLERLEKVVQDAGFIVKVLDAERVNTANCLGLRFFRPDGQSVEYDDDGQRFEFNQQQRELRRLVLEPELPEHLELPGLLAQRLHGDFANALGRRHGILALFGQLLLSRTRDGHGWGDDRRRG